MVDVEDRLIMEPKEIPVYMKNLYKVTPYPSVLTQDIEWDIPVFEDIDCPYCREENPQDLFYDGNIFIYVDPCGYLRFGCPDGANVIDIMFCPMCGRQFK